MSASVTESILEYLATSLASTTGYSFYRSREAPVSKDEGVVVLLHPDEEEGNYQATQRMMETFVVKFTFIARGDIPDQVADAARVALHRAIMRDTTLGGLCALIFKLGTKWDFELADRNAVQVESRYQIRYATRVDDLTVSA